MKKWMLILSCLFISIGIAVAQTTQATGIVVDDTGEEIIGASIVVKGTNTGTVTDIDGKFSVSLPAGKDVLVISYVGMKTKEVKASSTMRVILESNTNLDEVVVTAMGITKERKALGYASQGVSSEKLTQASNTSLSGALQGKTSGVQITPSSGMPGASSQIKIRGSRSFSGDNTPLYVVDGMPISSTSDEDTGLTNNGSVSGADFANRAVDIDPADIESIEILKGQAAAALYGLRASNGVVMITTKSGKNLTKGKPHITVSSSVSFDKLTRYPKMQMKYAQGAYDSKYGREVYNPNTSLAWGPLISELPNDPQYGGNVANSLNGGDVNKYAGKYYVPQRAAGGLDPWVTPRAYDNVKNFFDTGVTWNNSINVAQALEKSSYSVFLSSANQDGVIPSTGMDRYTMKMSGETKLTSQWTSGFVGTFVKSKIDKAPGANSGVLASVYGAPSSYDLNGIPSHKKDVSFEQLNYRGTAFDNPYWAMDNNEFSEKNSRFYGNAFINYSTKLNSTDKKLNVKYQLGADAYTTSYINAYGYGSKNAATGEIEEYSWENLTFNSLLTSTFNWTIDSDWNFSALLGNEIIHENKKYLYAYGSNYNFAEWNHIKNATVTTNSARNRSKRTVGFFGDLSVSYKSMVYLGVTGREDVVSFMPRNNRSFFYPSVNASFIVSELEGVKNSDIIDFAKIRASYAEVGQADDYRQNYFYSPAYGGGFYGFTPLQYPINGVSGFAPYYRVFDPNLKPQNTVSYEVGFDATFLKGLFDVSYTYSRQNVKDQIFDVPLAGSTGIKSILTNGGKVHTDVHEVTVNVNPVRTKLIDWSVGVNWTKVDNYVDELAQGVNSIFLGGFVTPQVRAGVNDKFPVVYGSDYKRDDLGRILVDEDGIPMTGKNTVIARVSPDFNLGLNTNLRIGKLNIAAVFDWKSGGEMYHGTNGLLNLYGVGKDTEGRDKPFIFDGWKEDGTKNDIEIAPEDQSYFYNALNNINASSVYKNSFIKLRELSVSYPVYKTLGFEVGVNAFARNILIWTNLPNFDPESSQGNNNMAGAFERFSMPQTSTYGFGVNVKF